MGELTAKQKRFCDEYLIDLNATQAAIRAGYSAKTARSQGQRLLTNVDVQEYLQDFQKRIDQNNIKSVEEVQRWWSEVIDDKEESMKDRLRASENLVKSKGGFIEKVNLSGIVNNPFKELTTEELKRLAAND